MQKISLTSKSKAAKVSRNYAIGFLLYAVFLIVIVLISIVKGTASTNVLIGWGVVIQITLTMSIICLINSKSDRVTVYFVGNEELEDDEFNPDFPEEGQGKQGGTYYGN